MSNLITINTNKEIHHIIKEKKINNFGIREIFKIDEEIEKKVSETLNVAFTLITLITLLSLPISGITLNLTPLILSFSLYSLMLFFLANDKKRRKIKTKLYKLSFNKFYSKTIGLDFNEIKTIASSVNNINEFQYLDILKEANEYFLTDDQDFLKIKSMFNQTGFVFCNDIKNFKNKVNIIKKEQAKKEIQSLEGLN